MLGGGSYRPSYSTQQTNLGGVDPFTGITCDQCTKPLLFFWRSSYEAITERINVKSHFGVTTVTL